MPDVFANITGAPLQALEMIASVLELRASIWRLSRPGLSSHLISKPVRQHGAFRGR
jgi:hypothetical protein